MTGKKEQQAKTAAPAGDVQTLIKRSRKKKINPKVQVFLIFGGLAGIVFMATSIVLAVGMLPSVVAAFVVTNKSKAKVITVGSLNLAGCSPFLLELWNHGNTIEWAVKIIADPVAIIIMYAGAAIGYVLDWAITGVVAGVIYQSGLARQEAIIKRQAELVDRWGQEVTGEVPVDEYGFAIKEQ